MVVEEKHLEDSGGGASATDEPLFTEEAEVEARPVVPLARVNDSAQAAGRLRGRIPQSLILVLAVIVAGAAGAAAGYLTFRERTPGTAVETTTAAAPAPDMTPVAVSESSNASPAEQSDVTARPEEPEGVEPERPEGNQAGVNGRAAEDRVQSVREERPRREREPVRAGRRHNSDERRAVRSVDVRESARRDEDGGGRPKARLVGTITVRSRH